MHVITALGVDIGASNGRGMVGKYDGQLLTLEELHRFANTPVTVLNGFYWDILNLFNQVKTCIKKANSSGYKLRSAGINTWAQDYALLDRQGNMLGNPHHYRDKRTDRMMEKITEHYSEFELYKMTGMMPYKINTLLQLVSAKTEEKALLENAESLLFMADLLNYFLTGNKNGNMTFAAISLMYDQFRKEWDDNIIKKFQLPPILPDVNMPGMPIGKLMKDVALELETECFPVVSVAAHDTASAVASIPEDRREIVYISCGTWSTLGTEISCPMVNRQAFEYGFCNELGHEGRVMFVKNLTGLWVLQECVAEWAGEGYKVDYDYMDGNVDKNRFNSIIDLDDEAFSYKGDMCGKIARYCLATGQPVPDSKEDIYRCVILSLAMKYKQAIDQLEMLTGKNYSRIHLIGGGSRNESLCRLTCGLTGKELWAGPYEATVIGNIAAQFVAMGELKDMDEAHAMIRRSFPPVRYCNPKASILESLYEKYLKMV